MAVCLLFTLIFANDAVFDYQPHNLTADGINYRIAEISFDRQNQLLITIELTNLTESLSILNTSKWSLIDITGKHFTEDKDSLELAPAVVTRITKTFPFTFNEDFTLFIDNRVVFEMKYYLIDTEFFQRIYPESMVVIQTKDGQFMLDRSDKKNILLTNQQHNKVISEVYLVVPSKNLALTRIDFKNYYCPLSKDATHLLIYYQDQSSSLIELGTLPRYFPEDIDISYQVDNNVFKLIIESDRNFQRVTAVLLGKAYPLTKNSNNYYLEVPFLEIATALDVTIYLKTTNNLYSKLLPIKI